jgi:hypothetical protein
LETLVPAELVAALKKQKYHLSAGIQLLKGADGSMKL